MQADVQKNLFLTGPIGCGKSTHIAAALGEHMVEAGGFLTLRQRDAEGKISSFCIQKPDGCQGKCFIDCTVKPYAMHMGVFETFGVALLKDARHHEFVVLDEIGGFELLSDGFMEALMALLKSEIPCIGVMKGEGPAGAMIEKLGLGEEYCRRAQKLRQWMRDDPHTLLYECTQFDPEGLRLAQNWVKNIAL